MTIHHLLVKPDTLNDLSRVVTRAFNELGRAGSNTVQILKFLLYDITVFLRKLPFGNYISILYFVSMTILIKNVAEGGELSRVLARALDLFFLQQKSWSECFGRFQTYLWRITVSHIEQIQTWAYTGLTYAWTNTSGKVKTEIKRFAREVVLDNADEIEKAVVDVARTAAFSAMVSAMSQHILNELGPAAFRAFSQSDLAITIKEIRQNTGNIDRILHNTETLQICSETQTQNIKAIDYLSGNVQLLSNGILSLQKNLADSVAIIMDAEATGNIHLLENNALLNQKLSEISAQIEYLRVNQPTQWKDLLNTVSLSTLAINDIGLPSAITDVFSQFSGTFSAQQGRKRIE